MDKTSVVIIGGGATGVGILRDLSMRGVKAVLLEQKDLAFGTSSRFHGLLHSGGRYAVKDAEAARECAEENAILRRIGRHCVEPTEGYFVRLPQDDPAYEPIWIESCEASGIRVEPVSLAEVRKKEPHISPRAQAVYRVPDAAVDGFRLCRQNVLSARQYGGQALTYHEVIRIQSTGGKVEAVQVRNCLTGDSRWIECAIVVNASGSWVDQVARLAGTTIPVTPDRGTLIALNHRLSNHIVNRLRAPANGDIYVPHGSVTIFGTTSVATDRPDDFSPSAQEIDELLRTGQELFEDLPRYRILRAYTGTRPLFGGGNADGRDKSRNFVILDHQSEGLDGLVSIVGGKLTTYRLMAEKVTDVVCHKLGNQQSCRTAEEPLIPDPSADLLNEARRFFPAFGLELAVSRLGPELADTVSRVRQEPEKKRLVCECELVTLAEVETVTHSGSSFTMSDIRRRTRMGMGTCQGSYCGLRAVGMMVDNGLAEGEKTISLLQDFLESRFSGIRPVLWGQQLKEIELTRGIYGAALNLDGEAPDETV